MTDAEARPRWRQIAEELEADITAGLHPSGSQIPTEAALAARFQVNRHTVRRAIESLSRAGLLRVEQGRGSFVADDVLDYAVSARTRFSEWIRRHNREPSGVVLQLREAWADAAAAAALGLPLGGRIVLMERLGLADGRPVGLTRHQFSAERFPALLDALRAHDGVTSALAAVGLADYRRQTTRVSARMPSTAEALRLRMPRTRPVLVTENVNVDLQGAPVEFGVTIYPTPLVQIVFEP